MTFQRLKLVFEASGTLEGWGKIVSLETIEVPIEEFSWPELGRYAIKGESEIFVACYFFHCTLQ